MKNVSLIIENKKHTSYNSQYVTDVLERSKLKATTMLVLNIYEDLHITKIKIATSGFTKKDFQIEINLHHLVVTATRQIHTNGKEGELESFGIDTFSKTYAVPSNIDTSKISAHFDNGLLVIDLPKKRIRRHALEVF
jgi:HSP20 family protein